MVLAENIRNHIQQQIDNRLPSIKVQIDMILQQANIQEQEYLQFIDYIKQNSQIGIHFHPDRISNNGLSVIENLLEEGVYKNQFETNISSGKLNPDFGGERAQWEDYIFGKSYHKIPLNKRPKYGALHLSDTVDGPAPRFGSCYFLTKSKVKNRSTFTYGDTYSQPREIGIIDKMELIYHALFLDLFTRKSALGIDDIYVDQFIRDFNNKYNLNTNIYTTSNNLDFYIEAQIHRKISLINDIESVFVDNTYKGTKYEPIFKAMALKYDIALQWYPGKTLSADMIPHNFRGNSLPNFVKRYFPDTINAYQIGKVANLYKEDTELQQMIKYVWHTLVKFG